MSARRTVRRANCAPRLETLEARLAPSTYTVTNANDSGPGSLRQAVLDANANPGADLIDFSSYFNSQRTITLAGEIGITGPVTIDGPSAANVTVSGNGFYRIFKTQDAPAGTAIGFVDLTLRQAGVSAGSFGGAISAFDEAITATRCVFTENVSAGGGGAIGILGDGSLTATDCVFTRNTANASGGGAVFSQTAASNLVLRRCEIDENIANGSFNALNGGGGVNVFGHFLLEDSTVSGNTAVGAINGYYGGGYFGYGGGLLVVNGSLATIRNSTISGNRAGPVQPIDPRSYGGGIYIHLGTLVVQNSTLTGNRTVGTGGGIWGGGFANSSVSLESCVVAGNSAGAAPDILDITGVVYAKTSSIFDRNGITTFNDLGGNRPAGEDPRLGPLRANGGSTRTHLLLPGSPCVNTGSNPANLTNDQRGAGFPRVLNGAPDMGAAEGVDPVPGVTPLGLPPDVTTAGGGSYTVVVRYDDDVGIDLTTIDLNDIAVTGPGYVTPRAATALSIDGTGQSVRVTYTFPAPGGTFDFFDAGLYTVTMAANQVADVDTPAPHFVAAGPLGTFRVAIPGALVVDEVSDIDDGNVAPGHLSLREAVRLTNAAVDTNDSVTFDPAIFGTPHTISLTGGAFIISDPLSIVGPGSGLLTLNAANASRQFIISSANVSLAGLNLVNGRAADSGLANGGAVAFYATGGSLTLSDIVASNCEAFYLGGAVYSSGSLTLRNCTITNNRAVYGGGVCLEGGTVYQSDLELERCTITNNQATGGGGGGIYWDGIGLIHIAESTISGNQANGAGAGGYLSGYLLAGSFIRNSTISGNSASPGIPSTSGGGLFLSLIGSLAIDNNTITGNAAGYGGGVAHANGYNVAAAISLSSSIIAGNSSGGAADSGPDLYYGFSTPISVVSNNSLIGVADSGHFTLSGTGNLTGTAAAPLNPRLAPLAANGGPTKTHALLAGSPALNAGSNPAGLATDQRGSPRVVGTAADIGAYEYKPLGVLSVQVDDGSAQRSEVRSLKVTFSGPVAFANNDPTAAFTLTRVTGGTVNLSGTASTNTFGQTVVTLTFTGGTATDPLSAQTGGQLSLADGRYRLSIADGAVTDAALGWTTDGDSNGTPGGSYQSPEDTAAGGPSQLRLFRLFGDATGNGVVDLSDLAAFRGTFNAGTSNPAFLDYLDADHNGVVDLVDLSEFRSRFNASVF